jgi:hypothetical protein
MATEIDIAVTTTTYDVTIVAEPNEYIVNITTGGGGGNQTLAQTLVLGNATGGENILINDADAIELENTSLLKKGTYDFGGAGGISRICSNQYEDMWQSGFRHVFDQSGFIRHSTNCFDVIPDSSFDNTLRFKIDSLWTLDDGTTYKCTDASTGAAVWEIYNNFIPTLQQVTDEGATTDNTIYVSDGAGNETSIQIGQVQILEAFGSYSQIGAQSAIFVNGDGTGADQCSVGLSTSWGDQITGFALSTQDGTNNAALEIKLPPEYYTDLPIENIVSNYFIPFKPSGDYTLATLDDIGGGGVPYTGATQDVDLGEFGLLTGNIEFDNTPTNIPTNAGSMVWNDTDGTVDLKLKGGNVTLQIGQENVLRVVNKTATNVNLLEANYQAVRVTGAQGQRLKVDLAQATTDALSAETIGLVTETINNNQEGFITTSGLIRNVNTTGSLQSETWADGDILYLSPTVAGRVTKVKPTAPNHLVIIGYVIHAHATQGTIFVKVDNGYELDELHNVKITTAANNQLLAYTSATDIWENKNLIDILKRFNRTQGVYYFEEFMGNQAGGFGTSYSTVISTTNGNASARTAGTTNRTNQQGIIQHQTGTGATNFAGYIYGSALYIGSGSISLETYITVETLSTITERFMFYFGYAAGSSNYLNIPNGIFFSYDEGGVQFAGGATPNWKCYTRAASGTVTLTTTSIPVVAAQWYKLRIDVNAAGNSVTFYIDETLVATHTTNIPATTTGMLIISLINKTAGTTARSLLTDYFMYEEIFTNPR